MQQKDNVGWKEFEPCVHVNKHTGKAVFVLFISLFFAFSFSISVKADPGNSTFNGTYNGTLDGDPINSILDVAIVNNIALNLSNPVIIVSPGQLLAGRLEVLERDPCSFCILPVVGVNSWDRTFFSDLGTIPGDFNFHRKISTFSFIAPTAPGDYFIAVVHAGCFAAADVVYGCYGLGDPRRGVPGGGDDIWDLHYFASWESLLPNGTFPNGVAIRVVASAKPDLSIKDIKPVQVVFDADINNDTRIDLVKGKNTSLIVDLNIVNPSALNNDTNVDFLVKLDNFQSFTQTFKGSEVKTGQVKIFFVPNFDGNATVNVTVNPSCIVPESNCNNNFGLKYISIKETNPFLITYKKVDYLGYVDKYDETVGNGTLFFNTTYPLNPQKFSIDNSNPTFIAGFPWPLLNPVLLGRAFNTLIDMNDVCIQSRLQASNTDVAVGIVPDNYFSFYGQPNNVGLENDLTCGILVQQTYWTAISHETGHHYGLPVNPAFNSSNGHEEYNSTYIGNPANGFWVNRNEPINNKFCFMGTGINETLDLNWIDKEDYIHLFKQFISKSNDPEALLTTGLIFNNGTVILGNWYDLVNSTIDVTSTGNYSIQMLNSTGNIINRTSFNVPFSIDFETGTVKTNATMFTLSVPFSENTSSVRIVFNNITIVEVNPSSKTLRDAINSIPNSGFINNPDERRTALLNKVNAFEATLKVNSTQGAVNKLKFDIRDKIEKWIVDYTPQNPLQLSKSYVLGLIDRAILRLNIQ